MHKAQGFHVGLSENITCSEKPKGKVQNVPRAGIAKHWFKNRENIQERCRNPATHEHDEKDPGGQAQLKLERISVTVQYPHRSARDVARPGGESRNENI